MTDDVKLYEGAELDDLESELDYVCRSLLEEVDEEEMILELRRREFTRSAAERYIDRVDRDLRAACGDGREYQQLQQRYTNLLVIGFLLVVVYPIIAFTGMAYLGLIVYGPILVGIGLFSIGISRKLKFAKYRRMWRLDHE